MTFEEIFAKKHTRRVAVLFLILTVALLIFIRYFCIPLWDAGLTQKAPQVVAKFTEDLATSLLVTLFVATVLFWLTPASTYRARVSVLDASELKHEFADGLNQSDAWWFSGGCGRYFRSAVVKRMNDRATAESSNKNLNAIILDPTNFKVCEQHAEYRAATSRGQEDGFWTPSRVKCELIATIVICLRASQLNRLLQINLYTSDRFSTFRVDISNLSAIETREDPKAPALKSPSTSDFYKALLTEFDILARQSKPLLDPTNVCKNVVDIASLKSAVSVILPSLLATDDEYDVIWKAVSNPRNPHA